ncbi:sigma-54-dependent transcriptional regulator [Trinickia sp.]|uniref:sigma-54-dependent transcriptional regulator n=1 Tax=Trinickia sp. TaxID=2571163 RepID=UPI003F81C35F
MNPASEGAGAGPDERVRVLLVEDDRDFSRSLLNALVLGGYDAVAAATFADATRLLTRTRPQVVLTDLFLGDTDGFAVLEAVHAADPAIPVLVMSGRSDVPTAIRAMQAGAHDFIEKPFDRQQLFAALRLAVQHRRMKLERDSLEDRLLVLAELERMLLGKSPQMAALRRLVAQIGPTSAEVTIIGETGTGKDLVARCLHRFSRRRGPFVTVDCAAIPPTLFESELFGYEAGMFTGATKQRIGRIESADGGTVFFDEIDAMPLDLQAKILRVLQERQVERLGSTHPVPVDIRVIAASKVDLAAHAQAGHFRSDLVFRLNTVTLRVPALRERREDVPRLLEHFLQASANGAIDATVERAASQLHAALLAHDWPGNVRELRNVAEQLQFGVPVQLSGTPAEDHPKTLADALDSVEKVVIEDALRRHDGNIAAVCTELQLGMTTLYRKLKQFGIELPRQARTAAEQTPPDASRA